MKGVFLLVLSLYQYVNCFYNPITFSGIIHVCMYTCLFLWQIYNIFFKCISNENFHFNHQNNTIRFDGTSGESGWDKMSLLKENLIVIVYYIAVHAKNIVKIVYICTYETYSSPHCVHIFDYSKKQMMIQLTLLTWLLGWFLVPIFVCNHHCQFILILNLNTSRSSVIFSALFIFSSSSSAPCLLEFALHTLFVTGKSVNCHQKSLISYIPLLLSLLFDDVYTTELHNMSCIFPDYHYQQFLWFLVNFPFCNEGI